MKIEIGEHRNQQEPKSAIKTVKKNWQKELSTEKCTNDHSKPNLRSNTKNRSHSQFSGF